MALLTEEKRLGISQDYENDPDHKSTLPRLSKNRTGVYPKSRHEGPSFITKEWNLEDTGNMKRLMPDSDQEESRPSSGEMEFWNDQLENNQYFRGFVDKWDSKVQENLGSHPAVQKFGLKPHIERQMTNMSPARRAQFALKK